MSDDLANVLGGRNVLTHNGIIHIYIYVYIYIHPYVHTYIYVCVYIFVGIDSLEYGVLRSTAADKHVPTKYALRQMQAHI